MMHPYGYRFDKEDEVVGVFFLGLLKVMLEEEGFSLKGYHGPVADLENYKKRVSLSQIFNCLALSLNDVPPGFGLRYGKLIQIASADTLGQLVMSSPSVGKAMEYLCRYRLLMAMSFDVDLVCTESVATLRSVHFGSKRLPLPLQYFLSEALYSCFVSQATWLTGQALRPIRLSFPYARPAHFKQYAQHFGCSIIFDAPCHEVAFERCYLDLPIPSANAALEKLKADHCESVLERWKRRFCIIQQVNDILAQSFPDFPPIESVAEQLGVSRSSLYRKLHERDTSYQCLINAFKRKQSIIMLKDTMLSVEEVAEHLGFSDASSFRRAFKGWTGQKPSVVRASGQTLQ
ncbi:MAG: hypothetical protein C9356_14190 [Oleiphilus sp.]|nr:MAG: hypothetical protein C9356_14190 [Oleiphilus sp.]